LLFKTFFEDIKRH